MRSIRKIRQQYPANEEESLKRKCFYNAFILQHFALQHKSYFGIITFCFQMLPEVRKQKTEIIFFMVCR